MNGNHPATNLVALFALAFAPSLAAAADPLEFSLEDLLKTDVTSATRKSQPLRDVAAAIYVITHDDIKRSGAATIPDLLRTVPGVEVAQMGHGRWAVSARGFGGRFANKLQVLMDGRSLYSPLFAGVMWEFEDTLIEDIERIEVIRGPGAAMWGANAVNGVINIITRKARDTLGEEVIARAGNEGGSVSARHGAATDSGNYRIWAKAFETDESPREGGGDGLDTWRNARAGFRWDRQIGASHRLTAIGGVFGGSFGDRYMLADVKSPTGVTLTDKRERTSGGHLLARHEAVLGDGSETVLQAYVDNHLLQINDFISERRVTADLDFQYHTQLGGAHDVVWGLSHHTTRDTINTPGVPTRIDPIDATSNLFAAFVHDDIALQPDLLRVALGLRLEHNSTTGLEPQPSLRMTWTPTAHQSIWGSVSRASRVPSRGERDVSIQLAVSPANPPAVPLPVLVVNRPTPTRELESERVDTVELGYRQVWGDHAAVDAVLFHSEYDRLRSGHAAGLPVPILTQFPPYLEQVVIPDNSVTARSHGLELSVELHPAQSWKLQAAYTYIKTTATSSNTDPFGLNYVGAIRESTPRHQFSLRAGINLGEGRSIDAALRYVGAIGQVYAPGSSIEAYTVLDLRHAWRPSRALEVEVGARNLGRRHLEWRFDYLASEPLLVTPSAYAQVRWNF